MNPTRRETALLWRDVQGEILIYDRRFDREHSLNGIAAAVWRLCDGTTPVSEMPHLARHVAGPPPGPAEVLGVLRRLAADHLVELDAEQLAPPAPETGSLALSRLPL